MTTAFGFEGTATSDSSRSSHAFHKTPRPFFIGSASIGRKPTETALRTPALARAQNSSADRDALSGPPIKAMGKAPNEANAEISRDGRFWRVS